MNQKELAVSLAFADLMKIITNEILNGQIIKVVQPITLVYYYLQKAEHS